MLWEQLKWICDVAELVRRRAGIGLEPGIVSRQGSGGVDGSITRFKFGADLFDTALPRLVAQEIEADRDIPALMQTMPKQLLKSPEQGIDESAEALYMMVKDSRWERWKLWCRVVSGRDRRGKSLCPGFATNIN